LKEIIFKDDFDMWMEEKLPLQTLSQIIKIS
jgi:hypothetical protein